MTNFAVIQTGGKEYKVEAGSKIKIEKIIGEYKVGDKLSFDNIIGKSKTIGASTGYLSLISCKLFFSQYTFVSLP